jgi:predicted peptidase
MNDSFTLLILLLSILGLRNVDAQLKGQAIVLNQKKTVRYYLYEAENTHSSPTAKFPLLVFLHGGGESGDNLEMVKTHGIPKLIAEGKTFPFYVLAPLNEGEKKFWDDVLIMNLIDSIIKIYPIDNSRIYLTGMSRGGYGAWRLALNNPGRFAALAVVCGASAPYEYARWITDIPIWVFHGAKDQSISISVSERMVEALKLAGAEVSFTIYPETGHDAWTETYANPGLYEWFLKQKRE